MRISTSWLNSKLFKKQTPTFIQGINDGDLGKGSGQSKDSVLYSTVIDDENNWKLGATIVPHSFFEEMQK